MNQAGNELEVFMRAAIEQGKLALPACLPNPPVGCVLVRNGEIFATGFTQSFSRCGPGYPLVK